ncbi:MAG: Gfo/Idh/MocA family oxidoreductase [Actinobacteria bacterium]|nr:Gfo/Idh/MocA family oxidoreductase [Actinomycetota bacterium]
MILVDDALRRRQAAGEPIRVAMVGAGAMGRAIAYQVKHHVPGMEVVAIANRRVDRAMDAYRHAGHDRIEEVSDADALARAIDAGIPAVTDDATLLCAAPDVDAIWEVTGAVEFGCHVALDAIAHGKHLVTMNAEMQGTVGPALKRRGDEAGVVVTDSDGDQPGVMMNLYRFVQGLGVRPVLLGNLKGLHDPYRNPTTQEDFARRKGLTPHMAASFADGTKMSFEMALVANATGLRAGVTGLYGFDAAHVHNAAQLYPLEQLLDVGLVDYLVGAEPAPGVFCLGTVEAEFQARWLELYKLGDGPLYTFYAPYHLCHLEAPTTVARAVLFGDAAVTPHVGHVVDVVATAKRDLSPGDVLDGIGWYDTYGQCENADRVADERLLPMGVAEGCRMARAVAQDAILTYEDVELPEGRLVDELRAELAPVPRR